MLFSITEKKIRLSDGHEYKAEAVKDNVVVSFPKQLLDNKDVQLRLSRRAAQGFLFSELEQHGDGKYQMVGELINAKDDFLSRIEFQALSVTLPDGKFTVSVSDSKHFTFWVKTHRKGTTFEGKRTISLFTGTQNTNSMHYTTLGFLNEFSFTSWKKVRESAETDARLRKALEWAEIMAFSSEEDWDNWGRTWAKESKRCYMCFKELTTPVSLVDGRGPECRKKNCKHTH